MSNKSKYSKLNFKDVKTYSIKERNDKVHISDFAKAAEKDPSFNQFIESLPNILAAKDFKEFIQKYSMAIEANSMIMLMMSIISMPR